MSQLQVGAFYYGYYGRPGQWGIGHTDTPVLGEYNSQTSSVLAQHQTWLRTAAIDFVIMSWKPAEDFIDETITRYLAQTPPTLPDGTVDPSILPYPRPLAIAYESKMSLDPAPEWTPIDFEAEYAPGQKRGEKFVADITELLTNGWLTNANYYKLDNRPVFYVWNFFLWRNYGPYLDDVKTLIAAAGLADPYWIGHVEAWDTLGSKTASTTLHAEVLAGAGTVTVHSETGFDVHDYVQLGSGATGEIVRIDALDGGPGPEYTWTLESPTVKAHAIDAPVTNTTLLDLAEAGASLNAINSPLMYVNDSRMDTYFTSVRDKWTAWRNGVKAVDMKWVPMVMPGYNDRVATGDPTRKIVARDSGSCYEKHWALAGELMDPDLPMLIVQSFNEWFEGHEIEPSTQYGSLYLTLTAREKAAWMDLWVSVDDLKSIISPVGYAELGFTDQAALDLWLSKLIRRAQNYVVTYLGSTVTADWSSVNAPDGVKEALLRLAGNLHNYSVQVRRGVLARTGEWQMALIDDRVFTRALREDLDRYRITWKVGDV